MGINQLPPSQRKSYRYMRFEIHSDKTVKIGEVVDAVWSSALKFLGTRGVAEADFWFLGDRFDEKDQKGIIKVERANLDNLRAALALVNGFSDKEGFIEVKKVSGSLKNLG